AKLYLVGALVISKALGQPFAQVLLGKRLVGLDDVKFHHFSGGPVGQAYGNAFEHARVAGGRLLDLVRVNIEARHQNHVFFSVYDLDATLLAHDADITGKEIAIGSERFGGVVGPLPVTAHNLWPLQGNFSGLAKGHDAL